MVILGGWVFLMGEVPLYPEVFFETSLQPPSQDGPAC